MPQESSKKPSYLLYGCFVGALCVGATGLYIYDQKQRALQAERIKISIEKQQQEEQRAEIQALSDEYLKAFIQDLKTHAASYKKQKRVLKEIISPYNFETPEYSKENYDLFTNEIAPSLRQKSNAVIDVFERYTAKLQKDIKDKDNKLQLQFMKEWSDMSTNQLSQYVDFFSHEEKLLQAYEELIRFYYIHSNLFSVDVEKNTFEFKRPKDKIRQAELLKNIKTLQFKPSRTSTSSKAQDALPVPSSSTTEEQNSSD